MFNPLLHERKIVDLDKSKLLAYNNLDVTETMQFVIDKMENIGGKEANAGYQHIILSPLPQMFSKGSYNMKTCNLWQRVKYTEINKKSSHKSVTKCN